MATATITITDIANGRVNIKMEFDPDIDMKSDGTNAQRCAFSFLDYMKSAHAEDGEDGE